MKKMKASTLRLASMLAVFAIVAVGLATHSGTGTVSSFGIGSIAAICPLGALETMIASKLLVPTAVVSLIVFLVLVTVFGKIFCAWICPVPLARKIFPSRFKRMEEGEQPDVSGEEVAGDAVGTSVEASVFHAQKPSRVKLDSRHFVLGGALVSTAVFGFPVFCLICPIGLTFASVIALWRLFGYNEPTILLIVFPAILILELVVFRKWCAKICPVGALLSLASSLNTFLRPKVDTDKCLRTTKGIDCRSCKTACFEAIDLHHAADSASLAECTKCRECADACPVSAISFPWYGKKTAASKQESLSDVGTRGDCEPVEETL